MRASILHTHDEWRGLFFYAAYDCNTDRLVQVLRRYAWFAPRTYDFDWIGPSASLLLADQPVLTNVGALYTGAPNSTISQSHAPAPASETPVMALGAAAQSSQAPARGVAGQLAAGGAAPAADLLAAAGAAGAAAGAPPDGVVRGGTWRGLCRVCNDQGAGLGALSATQRAARLQQCRVCGYWNYGVGLRDQTAGTLRSGMRVSSRVQHTMTAAGACMPVWERSDF